MTKKDMANLLLKALSLYAFLVALQDVPYLISDLSKIQEPGFLNILQISTPTLTMILAGILLWLMAGRGAKLIFGREATETAGSASIQDLQVLAFSLGGLYLVASSLPDLITNGLFLAWMYFKESRTYNISSVVLLPFIRLCIGLWLLFGAKGIVVFIKKIRRAGQFRGYNSALKQ